MQRGGGLRRKAGYREGAVGDGGRDAAAEERGVGAIRWEEGAWADEHGEAGLACRGARAGAPAKELPNSTHRRIEASTSSEVRHHK